MASEVAFETKTFKSVDLVIVAGRIDSSNASQFEEVIKELQSKGRHKLVLDMSDVPYLSSAGLRVMVSAMRENKKAGGNVLIANPSKRVADVLDLAGLDAVFEVFEDQVSAVGSY